MQRFYQIAVPVVYNFDVTAADGSVRDERWSTYLPFKIICNRLGWVLRILMMMDGYKERQLWSGLGWKGS